MADFTALKTAIQNAIKQNGNEEITGNLLQEVLLAIVTTLGDGSINDLITALGSEATTRQQADGTLQQKIDAEAQARQQAVLAEAQARQLADTTLQQNINAEATTRGDADTALGGRIDGVVSSIEAINNAIENGYVYAGIATPSSTPTTGKVFYLALTAGTYTNFGNIAVTQGINILKYNGSAWSLDAFVAIDDTPTPSSNNLVKSGGVKTYFNISDTLRTISLQNIPSIEKVNNTDFSAGINLVFKNVPQNRRVGYFYRSFNNVELYFCAATDTITVPLFSFLYLPIGADQNLSVTTKSTIALTNYPILFVSRNGIIWCSQAFAGTIESVIDADFKNAVGEINSAVGEIDKRLDDIEIQAINMVNINAEGVLIDKMLSGVNGVDVKDEPNWNTTDFVEIESSTTNLYQLGSFKSSSFGNVLNCIAYYYDENKQFISISGYFGTSQSNTWFNSKMIPSTCKYVRFALHNGDWNTLTFGIKTEVEALTSYVPFVLSIKEQVIANKEDIATIKENTEDVEIRTYDNVVRSINRIAAGTPYPIQTIEAFKYVVKTYGYRILLGDLIFTSDDVPVLSHDHYLNENYQNVKLADGSDIPDPSVVENRVYISDTTYQTLYDDYDFGVYAGSQFAGIHIPTFESLVKLCRNLECELYVEVKEATVDNISIATDIVKKYGMRDRTSWAVPAGSAGKQIALKIIEEIPGTRVGYMLMNITTDIVNACVLLKNSGASKAFVFGWDTSSLTDAIVKYMADNNVEYEMGTLNTRSAILNYFNQATAYRYCTGIETQTILAGKVLYEEELN